MKDSCLCSWIEKGLIHPYIQPSSFFFLLCLYISDPIVYFVQGMCWYYITRQEALLIFLCCPVSFSLFYIVFLPSIVAIGIVIFFGFILGLSFIMFLFLSPLALYYYYYYYHNYPFFCALAQNLVLSLPLLCGGSCLWSLTIP